MRDFLFDNCHIFTILSSNNFTKEFDMQVEHRQQLENRHSIEIGKSTWNSDETSIRNRYDLPNGKFSQHNSSEIPISDLSTMIKFACEHNALSGDELEEIVVAATKSLKKQTKLVW
jgi:hypothetical protein